MSYPALNHIEIRLDQVAGGTNVTLRHRAIGTITASHREGVSKGWRHYLDCINESVTSGGAGQKA